MKSKKEIEAELASVESKEQLHYPSADVYTNAPLALIQTELETRAGVLRWVLGLPKRDYSKSREERLSRKVRKKGVKIS